MLPLPLAQTAAPAAGVSTEFIGMVVLSLVFLSRWLWDYNRQKREEDERKEPKSNPPLHERFVEVPDYQKDQELIDERLNSATASRKKMHGEIDELGNRVTALETSNTHFSNFLTNLDRKVDTILSRTARK